ncbi:MAG: FAD-dependent oxidoreductase [Chlamydiales bacterium]
MKILRQFFLAIALCAFSEEPAHPVVILGGGIGALTSALYLGRAELHPVVLEGQMPGGLLTQSHSVQNWPGIMEIQGHVLTEQMRKQAVANGALIYSEEVIGVDFSKRPFTIKTQSTDGKKTVRSLKAENCIIAMGTQPNYLNIPGEKDYWGRGVTNCAVCDGNLYQGKKVGVVGGGDAAVLEALYLSNIASDVTIFVRKDKLRATEKKRIQSLLSKPNIKIMYGTEVSEVKGDQSGVQSVVLNAKGKKSSYPLDGLFLAIGSTPNSQLFKNDLKLDSQGYIVVHDGGHTSVTGVYAVGDIVDPVFKQAVTASGDAAKAAMEVQQCISDQIAIPAKPLKEETPVAQVGTVIEIKSLEQFEQELEMSETPLIVDFYASWCAPCKKVVPILEETATRLNGKVKFLKVNVEKVRVLSTTYEIRSMPTVLLMDSNGDVLERQVGLGAIVDLLAGLME